MSLVRKPDTTAITSGSEIVQSAGSLSNRFLSVAPVEFETQPQFGGVPPTSQLSSNDVRTVTPIAGMTEPLMSACEIAPPILLPVETQPVAVMPEISARAFCSG